MWPKNSYVRQIKTALFRHICYHTFLEVYNANGFDSVVRVSWQDIRSLSHIHQGGTWSLAAEWLVTLLWFLLSKRRQRHLAKCDNSICESFHLNAPGCNAFQSPSFGSQLLSATDHKSRACYSDLNILVIKKKKLTPELLKLFSDIFGGRLFCNGSCKQQSSCSGELHCAGW